MNSLSTQQAVEAAHFAGLRRIASVTFLGLAMAALAACAAVNAKPAEEIVKERAQERWDALLKGDLQKAYGFLSPGSKAVTTFEGYERQIRRGFWKSAVVNKVVCASAQTCEADATIEYEFRGRRIKTPLREPWIKEGSDWWYLQK